MISIRDALGAKWYEIKLYDDNSVSYGGMSHSEETLGEFIEDSDLNAYEDTIGELQKELKACGLKEIEAGDSYIQELIEQRIWDMENELNIDIVDYRWDYK